MSKISVSEMMKAVHELKTTKGIRCTLLGIGPMSGNVIEESFNAAKKHDFPLMFIASRNQVDCKELGGGYVFNWDQHEFVAAIRDIAEKTGFEGLYYICRDHGGPWQRDDERNGKLPPVEAMNRAKQSLTSDLLAGFDLLHIDPTKDPHVNGVVPMETVIGRTLELIEHVEGERVKKSLPAVAYEVGTEETNGGLTSQDSFSMFIELLVKKLREKGLPCPDFIVGQTGTLTRLTENIGCFNASTALKLSMETEKYGIGLKEHNADYLPDHVLCMHPILGVAAANVAPEFGVAEMRAYLLLADVELNLYKLGILKEKSNFIQVIREETVKCQRWRKWMVGDICGLCIEEVMRDEKLVDKITETSGHYNFYLPSVNAEILRMFHNLESVGLKPQTILKGRIRESVEKYVDCFNLKGLTSMILNDIH